MRLSAASAVSRLARAVSTLASEVDRLGHQVGLTFEGDIGLAQDGLRAGEIGLLDRYVELDELGADRHILAALESEPGDDAGDLRGDLDALRGDERADGRQPLDPFLGFRGLGRDRGYRRRPCELRNSLIIFGLKTSWKYASPPTKEPMMMRAIRKRLIMVPRPAREGWRAQGMSALRQA